ncbi:unnamed protein product [Linum tenue]|uniref:F-box domain-containing protein n=1 Tax=Linum tenue TaxID=586396 RepID=A0AAV0NJB6_9ROSI|nr:unnamed protein product [Linum tenue]
MAFDLCREYLPPPPPLNLLSKLGDDPLVVILIRLPNPRSSCLSKTVCKSWRTLISDPSFDRHFISHHQTSSFREILFVCNPFRLDRSLKHMIVSHALWYAMGQGGATLAVSQGALHIVVFEVEGKLEIVFLKFTDPLDGRIYSCNLRSGMGEL